MEDERIIEYGDKRSYLRKRRSSHYRVGSFRRQVMDAINDNVDPNPLYRFSSCGDLPGGTRDDDTIASSVTSSFSSLPRSSFSSFSSLPGSKRGSGHTGSMQNVQWESSRKLNRNLSSRYKLMDRGQLLGEIDRQSSRLLPHDTSDL
ncbi:unnamed protein product [Cylindrotheca closterium]|uniref:Uncharacterized protein n=1 Tax=Cylindrotheca closterium TaxID=2856 RepID=A0AAD2PTY0_9STRA|nr:unnamed protein product [Cylindrotheca closterium]